MNKETLQIRVPTEMRTKAEAVFSGMGLKMSEAVRIFLQQSINANGLPFQPTAKTPNAETLQAMRDADEGKIEKTSLAQLKKDMKKSGKFAK